MKTRDIFIAHPQTSEQVSALKAFMEALKIKFEISKNETNNSDVLDNIKAGLEEVKLFQKGELQTTSAKDFLDEL
jgi:uncharacterized protein YlxP (DUF503 family)